jgi:hypothetical protein
VLARWGLHGMTLRIRFWALKAHGKVAEGAAWCWPCRCGDPAKLNKVSKAGPNQGREFWGCPHWKPDGKHCTFFRWALNDDFHSKKDLALQWQVRCSCCIPSLGACAA